MSLISCLIQRGGLADGCESELEVRLAAHHRATYTGEEPQVAWRQVAPEMMFTAGAPSRTSVISCVLPGPTTRDAREAYMRGICELWSEVTGCDTHDLLVSITEDQQGS